MEKLNGLTDALNTARNTSVSIISKALPLMKAISSGESELILDVMDESEVPRDEAIKFLQNALLGMTLDAKTVLKEIDLFSRNVMTGKKSLDASAESYPFLLGVWCGDAYGESGVAGLKELGKDLAEQLSEINDDAIVAKITE